MNEEEETTGSENTFYEDAAKSAGECLSLALKYLSYRSRSVFEVRKKLAAKESFKANTIEETIDKLTGEGYLNDHSFAEELVRHRIDIKSWGRLKITADLQRHGVERETITEVISALCSCEEELSTATKALTKWLRIKGVALPLLNDNKMKAMRHLASRGFTTETVRRALDNLQ
jgi:regulatory protein